MTQVPTITSEMDHLHQLGAKAFDGFLVRKDLVRKYSRQYPVPTYVVEFLLGRYCASTDPAEIAEGLETVEKQLQGRTVRTGEEELLKARSHDQGSVKIIDIVRARLDTRSDSYARCATTRPSRIASTLTPPAGIFPSSTPTSTSAATSAW